MSEETKPQLSLDTARQNVVQFQEQSRPHIQLLQKLAAESLGAQVDYYSMLLSERLGGDKVTIPHIATVNARSGLSEVEQAIDRIEKAGISVKQIVYCPVQFQFHIFGEKVEDKQDAAVKRRATPKRNTNRKAPTKRKR